MAAVELSVLGPLAVTIDGQVLALGGQRQRTVLGLLVMSAGTVVSTDRLMDAVWGDDAIDRSRNTLQVYVSNLRRLLGPIGPDGGSPIRHAPPGYALDVDPSWIDGRRFVEAATSGERLLSVDPERAVAALDEALASWRGSFLEDLRDDDDGIVAERIRFAELRLRAQQLRVDGLIAAGRPASAVPELESLVVQHPTRERLWGQLMLALYRSGRQAEALRAFRRARTALAEEAGLDPGSELVRLERSMVAQSPRLAERLSDGPRLVCFDTRREVREYRLDTALSPITIGRSPDAGISLPWDGQVSRDHARMFWRGGSWEIVDEGSRNGSYVNARRVTRPTPFGPGDHLRFGTTVLVFVGDAGAAPPATTDTTIVQ